MFRLRNFKKLILTYNVEVRYRCFSMRKNLVLDTCTFSLKPMWVEIDSHVFTFSCNNLCKTISCIIYLLHLNY